MRDILTELGLPTSTAKIRLKLRRESNGDIYVNVNTGNGWEWMKLNMCSSFLPEQDTLKAWYGYDHSAQGVFNLYIEGKTKVLPGATITYNAVVTGVNLNGIRIRWDRFDGTNWVTNIAMGTTMTITWGDNPNAYKLRATVLGQCQGGTTQAEITITQAPTYYNILPCFADTGVPRQTDTVFTTPGQGCFRGDGSDGAYFWTGTVTSIPTDYYGPVVLSPTTWCGDLTPYALYYTVKRCSDNALFSTTTPIGVINQRVKDSSNNMYTFTGEVRKFSAPYTLVTVSLVHDKLYCLDNIQDVYYQLQRCETGEIAYTTTPIQHPNAAVSAGILGIYLFTGVTTTIVPPNVVGEVHVVGWYGCDATGSPGSTVYSVLQKCSDGSALFSTTQKFTASGQRVTHPTHGTLFWNGNTSLTPVGTVLTVTEVTGQTQCPGNTSTNYYQLMKCNSLSIYYTTTNPGTAGQRVTSGSMGELTYTGVVITATALSNIGPVTIVTGQTGCSGSTPPPTFSSEASQKVLTKNDCPSGQHGTAVTVTAAEGQFTSTVSQADANAQRDAWMQAQANINGTCTGTPTYVNDVQSGFFYKNNCPSGQTSSQGYVYTIPAGAYTSTTSKDHANSLAIAALNSQGQAYANSVGDCVCNNNNWQIDSYYCVGGQLWAVEKEYCNTTATGQTRNIFIDGCSSSCNCTPTHYSDARTATLYKNNCASGAYGSSSHTITATAGQFASSISKEHANQLRDEWMQQQANTVPGSVCYYGNDYMGQTFTKACSDGGSGSDFWYDVAANTFTSTISKEAANSMASAHISANGQAAANSAGVCTWGNDYMGQTFYKSCPDGGNGSSFYYAVPAGYFTSTVSKADANSQAASYIAANGQATANALGICTWCPDNRGHWIQRNNCPSGQQGGLVEVFYPRSLCELGSTISKNVAEDNLNNWFFGSEAQNIANANGTCSSSEPFYYRVEYRCVGGGNTTHALIMGNFYDLGPFIEARIESRAYYIPSSPDHWGSWVTIIPTIYPNTSEREADFGFRCDSMGSVDTIYRDVRIVNSSDNSVLFEANMAIDVKSHCC